MSPLLIGIRLTTAPKQIVEVHALRVLRFLYLGFVVVI